VRARLRRGLAGDLAGSVADLGVLVPLAATLVVVCALPPGPVLVGAGLLVLGSGLWFKVPFPVQPLKALTAIAVAKELAPGVINAAGMEIGLVLLVLGATGLARVLATWFTKPVIRALQLGVGTLLMITAIKLTTKPPKVFAHVPPRPTTMALAALVAGLVAIAAWRKQPLLVLLVFGVGVVVGCLAGTPAMGEIAVRVPTFVTPDWAAFGTAFVVLVIPQLPLTFGNAVVGVSNLEHEVYGGAARRVSPASVSVSAGIGNVGSALIGGMPMCHGSSGLSAHARLGARTATMNVVLGSGLLVLGLVFADQILALFSVLPVWVLAGFLFYAGVRHALLVLDQRGRRLAIAVLAAAAGIWLGNLAVTTAIALAGEWIPFWIHGRTSTPAD
jgi:SulP family sulfate permease